MIRKATAQDIDRIEEIYKALTTDKDTCKFTNWAYGVYPTREVAEGALLNGELFVGEDENGIYGSMLLNTKQLPEYSDIPWKYDAMPEEVLVIHTLCIDLNSKGKGYARAMVKFAENFGKENNMKVIRLDTYEGNIPAITMYPKFGYKYSGKAFFNFMGKIPENLVCFEKLL